MPKVRAGDLTMNYEIQGGGEPLVLIPFLAADQGCYAFQLAEYARHFTCISVDLRGAGETEDRGHASIYEKVEEFNRTSLEFLKRQAG